MRLKAITDVRSLEVVLGEIQVRRDVHFLIGKPAGIGIGVAHPDTGEELLGGMHDAIGPGIDLGAVAAELGSVAGRAGFFQQGFPDFRVAFVEGAGNGRAGHKSQDDCE